MASDSEVNDSLSQAALLVGECKSLEATRNHIDEAIALDRQALALCQPGHISRADSLTWLSIDLSVRYEQFGDLRDIEEGIVLNRAALELRPPGHPDRGLSFGNIACGLYTRYKQFGAAEDLDEAIDLGRDALLLCPPGHSDYYSVLLSNLGAYISTRYEKLGAISDLNEAIELDRDALGLRPPGHPDRSMSLNNLALNLGNRYNNLGAVVDLDEVIALGRDALELRPPGHPLRPNTLNSLAFYLGIRYKKLGIIEDLDDAITLDHEVLVLCLPVHPFHSSSLNNLAAHLHTRYQKLNAVEDLHNAVKFARDSLALRPPGHHRRAISLKDLTSYLDTRFKCLRQSKDKDEIFELYSGLVNVQSMVSSDDLSAARSWILTAEHYRHSTTVLAYETTLRLLTYYLATLPMLPQHLTLIRDIVSSLAVDAFSACLRNYSSNKAVELLEQGRGVFLNQLTRLRFPVDDIIAAGPEGEALLQEFTRVTSLIREAFSSVSADQHDRVCHLNIQLQRITANICKLPGLSRFLLPPLYSDLQRVATCGPVIVLNASQYGCDALIISLNRDPIHVALQISREEARALTTELYRWTKLAKTMSVGKNLVGVFRPLWDKVVSPIADVLQTILPLQSRVWWCPTSEFILLPLHAAGTYRSGQPKFTDLYVSSYTPSLSALIHARRCPLLGDITREKHFVAIGQADAAGESKLQSIGKELTTIGERVNGLASFTRMEGKEASISRVVDAFGKNDWVHLACHGLPNREQPFKSAFGLSDGRLTIQRIIQCELDHPEFAYLSACHTTVGDQECLDEMIHLASAMQFIGFRSIIGTMWAVDDAQTIKITSRFYEKMKNESGRLDHTRAAVALHETMKELEGYIGFDQRILYVHLGA